MGAAIAITRTDHDAAELRRRALRVREPDQARRMLAIAMVLEGASRLDAARQAGMDRQTLRDWVLRYNAGGIGAETDPGRDGRTAGTGGQGTRPQSAQGHSLALPRPAEATAMMSCALRRVVGY